MRPGLVSVTFRQLCPEEIVRLAVENGLEAIEWGGDVHVPPGALHRANEVRSLTEEAGLQVACYGSYFRAGTSEDADATVKTASELGAPLVRIWAGSKASQGASAADYAAVESALGEIAERAARHGIRVSLEFHPNTLADTAESTLRLLGRGIAGVNWQPDPRVSHVQNLRSLQDLAPHLTNLHVFNWIREGDQTIRRPLDEAATVWREYLETAHGDRFALIEFVPGDDPGRLPAESSTLREWLA
ncbi:MAG TPA: TIM barrel protein [Fimbriimonas sp.]|nr:TIM barrel protein [Fimbriimonas sp.]